MFKRISQIGFFAVPAMIMLYAGIALSGQGISTVSAATVSQTNKALLAAASPFEDLTDYALSRDEKGIVKALDECNTRVENLSQELSAKNFKELKDLFASIKESEAIHDYSNLALNSVNAYKLILESLNPDSLAVPQQVAMLDYAGFYSRALLMPKITDWKSLQQTASDAETNWAAIRSRVPDKYLRDAVDVAIAGMDKAYSIKDTDMALFSADMDLALVDMLQGYFENPAVRAQVAVSK